MTEPTRTKPQTLTQIEATRRWVRAEQAGGATVGLVPTMGALHEGHLSLVRAARQRCERVVVSVFVNPTQFAPNEDFQSYPRDLAADTLRLAGVGADVVFAPADGEMYPAGFDTRVEVGAAARPLEGASRPEHFAGVATVVAKLFAAAPADLAFFGQKDYQQTVVVRRMACDLNLPVGVVVCPTVREPDGLAMSSRNAYLSPEERRRALALSRSLGLVERLVAGGERDAGRLADEARSLIRSEGGIELDYFSLVRDGTVDPVERVDGPTVVLVAGRVGRTRLIDNARIA